MTRCTLICGKTILSRPDINDAAERFTASPRLPRDEGGPVFAEPWQAQAFAMAVQLSAAGHFTWTEWMTVLGAQLQAAADRGEPDDGSRYFEHWLAALEQLVAEKQLTDRTALRARKAAWADAYRRTPHGQSVELRAKCR
jgi:nitrile hydratase accessory protein